jgi:polysaccharide export outer membrane protein
MRQFYRILSALLILWLQGAVSYGQSASATVETPAAAPSFSAISAKDLILVRVFQEDDLESTLRVAEDGTIVFPLIGKIAISGRSPQEAAGVIRDALRNGFIRNPQVTVTVVEHSKRRFTVLGQVQKPGAYELPDTESITLLQAIGMAGGYTNIADPGKVVIKRRVEGKETIYKLNAREMAKGGTSNAFQVINGDVVSVGESWF